MRPFFKTFACLAVSMLLLSGCGEQALTQLKPHSQKQSVGIVFQADQQTIHAIHQFVQDQMHTAKDTLNDYGYSKQSDADAQLSQLAQSGRFQMFITNASAAAVASVQEKNKSLTTAWIPDIPADVYTPPAASGTPSLVPAVTVNQDNVAFLDGFLSGQLQGNPSAAIVVPAATGVGSNVARMVQAGLRDSGFTGFVPVYDLSNMQANPPGVQQMGSQSYSKLFQMIPQRIWIIPVPVDAGLLRAAASMGKQIILGYPAPFVQSNLIADVHPAFVEKVQTLIEQWEARKWKPGQTISFFSDHIVQIRNVSAFRSRTIQNQLQALEQSIANHSFDPHQVH
ncbi:hypothetical protein LSG31_16125 [Fodinisporobacter ferrooxydans]|uniref:ABC transporter substrate-binding protein n=1 Tax=Fodinisporobacter ferrooxydans TaxID=2901836 RepID=A0ABY4CGJ8_9BACL|nr:hypothetical protein LSG31_16125 [Alicyclobacillaceae bacterium MYW30-H2]